MGGHGKHYAKRQRRKAKKLAQLREKGHATIAKLKDRHSKERKALRTQHRQKGSSYSDRSSETKALRSRHKAESRQTIDSLKKEARDAFPKATGQSSKAKEFKERVEKANKFEATHGVERTKQAERHEKERAALTEGHRTERKELHALHAKERAQTVADNNRYHREDAQHIINRERADVQEEHAGQRQDLIKDQRREWKDTKRQHEKDKAGLHKELTGERAQLKNVQRGERRDYLNSYKNDSAEAKFQGTEQIRKGLAELRTEQHGARQEMQASHQRRIADQKADHKKELGELKAEHQSYRHDVRADQRAARKAGIEDVRRELEHNKQVHSSRLKDALHAQREEHAEEHAAHQDEATRERRDLERSHKDQRQMLAKMHKMAWRAAREHLVKELKGRSYELGFAASFDDIPRLELVGRQVESGRVPVRFAKSRTHKASSAEAILKHCLRQRGFTSAWRRSELTGKQHLNLLDDVRQYGRMHMRHEAETLFDRYGVEVDELSGIPARSFQDDKGSAERAWLQGVGWDSSLAQERGIASRAIGAISRFFDRAKGFILELIFAGGMALKGPDGFTSNEHAALNNQATIQRQYLDKFEQEVIRNPPREIAEPSSVIIVAAPEPMTPGQFIARAESYGNAPWEVQNVGRETVRKQEVFKSERRVHLLSLEAHRPCKGGEMGCLEQSQMGWQPIGTLREIGDCYCMNNCDCYFEWQDPKGKIHVSPWGRHNPRGFNQDGQLPGTVFPVEPAIPALPSGPGPAEKPPRKIKLKPRPERKPKDLEGIYPTEGPHERLPRPLPTVDQLLKEANSPYGASDYEEA